MSLSRRSLVASAATLPAPAVPATVALSAQPDPIFAAIEKYRAANAAFIAQCDYEEETGLRMPDTDTTYQDALAELAKTAPTTREGLIAYLDFVITDTERLSGKDFVVFFFDGGEQTLAFVHSVARSVRTLTPPKQWA